MKTRAATGSGIFTINRPAWQANLPRGLRIAAEWQFGTWIIFSVLAAVQGELLAFPVGLAFSGLLFLFLSGWSESRRINSPIVWWAVIIGMSLLAAFSAIGLIADPPE